MSSQGEGISLTNRILQLIEVALKKVNATLTGTSSTGFTGVINAVEESTNAIEAGNQIIGSGINLEDGDGHGSEPFDSAIKLRKIEDDSSTGITYIGYSAPDTATTSSDWIVQKITSVESGDITTHDQVYATGSWDNRATLNYY